MLEDDIIEALKFLSERRSVDDLTDWARQFAEKIGLNQSAFDFLFVTFYYPVVFEAKKVELSDSERALQILSQGMIYPMLNQAFYLIGKRLYEGPPLSDDESKLRMSTFISIGKEYLRRRGNI